MREFIAAHPDWLTVVRLLTYAPELNPAEGAWANLKKRIGQPRPHGVDHLAAIVKSRLRHIQYRPDLINGFLAQTGLTPLQGPATCADDRRTGRRLAADCAQVGLHRPEPAASCPPRHPRLRRVTGQSPRILARPFRTASWPMRDQAVPGPGHAVRPGSPADLKPSR